VLPEEPGNAVERLQDAGVEVLRLPLGRLRAVANPIAQARFLSRLASDVRGLRGVIRERRPALVQVHGPTNPQAAVAARFESVPVVWQLLDTRAPMALRRAAAPVVKRYSDVVMTTGLLVAHEHPGIPSLEDRLVPYYPPVDPAEFAPDREVRARARRELGVPDGACVIGTVGNLNPQKGHEYLIRAASALRKRHPSVCVRILGAHSPAHSSLAASLTRLAASCGLREREALSFVDPRARVAELIQAFDIFVLAAVRRSEGVPTVLLEAMGCALPAVATDVGSVREVVSHEENGFVVPSEDSCALASTVDRLIQDPELRRRIGARGRAQLIEHFGIEHCVEQHLAAYARALSTVGAVAPMGHS